MCCCAYYKYPQDSPTQDCSPGRQSAGGESWYPGISRFPTPIILCFCAQSSSEECFEAIELFPRVLVSLKMSICCFEVNLMDQIIHAKLSNLVVLFGWKGGSHCTLFNSVLYYKKVTYAVYDDLGKSDMTSYYNDYTHRNIFLNFHQLSNALAR